MPGGAKKAPPGIDCYKYEISIFVLWQAVFFKIIGWRDITNVNCDK